VAELENLPFGLSSKEQVQTVRDWYVESYDELKKFPEITSMEDEAKFTVGLYKCVVYYEYKNFLLPDAARKQNELVLLNKRLERHAPCRGLFFRPSALADV
jgi:hypothetical protein